MTDALMRKVVNTVASLDAVLQKHRVESTAAREKSKAAIEQARGAASSAGAGVETESQRVRRDLEAQIDAVLSGGEKYGRRDQAIGRQLHAIYEAQERRRWVAGSGELDVRTLGTARPIPSDPSVAFNQLKELFNRAWTELQTVVQSHMTWAQGGGKRWSRPTPPTQSLLDDFATALAWARLIPDSAAEKARTELRSKHGRLTGEADQVLALQTSMTAETLGQLDQELQSALPVAVGALTEIDRTLEITARDWGAEEWLHDAVASTVRHDIRFGAFEIKAPGPAKLLDAPALLSFPFVQSLVIDRLSSGVAARGPAVEIARGICARLLAAVPPGKLQFTFIDPVALGQSVADFQHLADYNQDTVGTAPATTSRDIEARLQNLTVQVETVISKYLRGQFQTIEEYNAAAGEVAEPYRILVVFDFPTNFSESAAQQLLSLMTNGPRCGLFTIVVPEPQMVWPQGVSEKMRSGFQALRLSDSPRENSVRITYTGPLGTVPHPIIPDPGPAILFGPNGTPESPLARLMTAFGERLRDSENEAVTLDRLLLVLARAIEANRVANLPAVRAGASAITKNPSTWWTATTARNTIAPIGRSGAQDVTSLIFSSTEVAGGAIVVGLPRSGKSTSLHAAILTMCMLYPPDELELYLLDARQGVEFKIYESLPHARMVSINSEREFSVAVLKSLVAEITRRAELMKSRAAGKTNITEYRQATGDKMPRIVVLMDEFHETFEEDDKLGHEAFAAFSDIVRQGPASGVHIVVASQTLSSMPAMDRDTLKLLPERIAFMCNDSDAEIVMGEDNRGTRTLAKAGEGLFNPQRGAVAHNKPFQGLFIESDERIALLRAIQGKAIDEGFSAMPRVFDGDSPARRPTAADADSTATRLRIPIGEPFSLSPYDAVPLRRTREANVLLLGDIDDAELPDLTVRAALHSCITSARSVGAAVSVVDFIGDEDGVKPGSTVRDVAGSAGARYARGRGASEAIKAAAAEVDRRIAAEDYDAPTELLVLFGVQRATGLAPATTDSWSDEPVPESDGTTLSRILRDGPEFGVHVIVSADTAGSVQRRLGSDSMAEFSQRVGGSNATAADLALITDAYGDVPPVRRNQLIYHDRLRGRIARVRGYTPIVTSED